jgi:hypothetical protein
MNFGCRVHMARTASIAGAAGTTTARTAVPPTATGTPRGTGTTTWASAPDPRMRGIQGTHPGPAVANLAIANPIVPRRMLVGRMPEARAGSFLRGLWAGWKDWLPFSGIWG